MLRTLQWDTFTYSQDRLDGTSFNHQHDELVSREKQDIIYLRISPRWTILKSFLAKFCDDVKNMSNCWYTLLPSFNPNTERASSPVIYFTTHSYQSFPAQSSQHHLSPLIKRGKHAYLREISRNNSPICEFPSCERPQRLSCSLVVRKLDVDLAYAGGLTRTA